jgi:TrmH family RNA methyltransferase
MERITSRKNPLIVEMAKLKDKKHRRGSGLFFFEGRKLFLEAIANGICPVYLFVREDTTLPDVALPSTTRVYSVTTEVYEKLSEEKSPQGIICVAKHLDNLHDRYIIYSSVFSGERIFLVSHMQDPGNLGTVLRTANALGCDRIILSEDSADLYHPRTVRASMGALFRQRVAVVSDLPATITALRQGGYQVYAAALKEDAVGLQTLSVTANTAFLIGNEGQGLTDAEIAACDGATIIPMTPGAESLNAAAAAAILLWESAKHTF